MNTATSSKYIHFFSIFSSSLPNFDSNFTRLSLDQSISGPMTPQLLAHVANVIRYRINRQYICLNFCNCQRNPFFHRITRTDIKRRLIIHFLEQGRLRLALERLFLQRRRQDSLFSALDDCLVVQLWLPPAATCRCIVTPSHSAPVRNSSGKTAHRLIPRRQYLY